MKIDTDTHYLFRMINMEDEDKHRYTLLIRTRNIGDEDIQQIHTTYSGCQTWKMKINTDTHYLFRMTNMEDEDKHRYTLLIRDDQHGR